MTAFEPSRGRNPRETATGQGGSQLMAQYRGLCENSLSEKPSCTDKGPKLREHGQMSGDKALTGLFFFLRKHKTRTLTFKSTLNSFFTLFVNNHWDLMS